VKPEDTPDLELIASARGGDSSAFRTLVERHEPRVAATVIGMLGAGADAEDVGQEVFVRFHRALDQFRGDAAVGTYLTRIAINLSLNASKRRQRSRLRFWSRDQEEAPPPEPSIDGQDVVDQSARRDIVRWGIQQLRPDHRAVVVLRMIEEYSTKETADLLDLAEGTVLSRLSRGMARLKEILLARGVEP
jgi:RNA polymerase sigma-70 factor, ECF subfamily